MVGEIHKVVGVSDLMANLLGNVGGVDVGTVSVEGVVTGFELAFENYDAGLINKMHRVAGNAYKADTRRFTIPLASQDDLAKALPGMRFEVKAIASDREAIMALATKTAIERQAANGTEAGVKPRLSDFREAGQAYIGDIINANGRFAAQLTGFGDKDGITKVGVRYKAGGAFVTIHRQAELDRPVAKGEKIGIQYSDKNRGVTFKTKEQNIAEYEESLGKEVDGVKVVEGAEVINVSFGVNAALRQRLERIADVHYNKEAEAFQVPLNAKDFVIRAVADMRADYVVGEHEKNALKAVAEKLIDGPKVELAFAANGAEHSGVVVDFTDHYLLQKGSLDKFKLHNRAGLNVKEFARGQDLDIKYNKGLGTVIDRDVQKAQNKVQSAQR